MMADAILGHFGRVAKDILGLNAPGVEIGRQQNDRVSVAGSYGMAVGDQSDVTASRTGTLRDEVLRSAVDLPGTVQTQAEKFYLMANVDWSASSGFLDRVAFGEPKVDNGDLNVVEALLDSALASTGLVKWHSYMRFGLDILVQINPSPFQQGGLGAFLAPGSFAASAITSYFVYPHCLLNCNINNSGRIVVPWVHTRGMHRVQHPLYPPWLLRLIVLDRLAAAADTSQQCTVTVLGRFTSLELHGLRPMMKSPSCTHVTIGANLNVVNFCSFQQQTSILSMCVGEESFRSDPSLAGGVKLTDFLQFCDSPGLVGQVSYQVSNNVGDILLNVPVHPYLYCINYNDPACVVTSASHTGIAGSTPMGSIASQYCFWRGDITFYIQVFPTRYHSGRLLMAFHPGRDADTFSNLTLKKATSCQCAIMDVSGVCSTFVFRIPFCSDSPLRVNKMTSQDGTYDAPGIDMGIGRFFIFVYNKLTAPHNVAQQVHVNVYIAGANMEFYGPTFSLPIKSLLKPAAGDDETEKPVVQTTAVEKEPNVDGGFDSTGFVEPRSTAPVPVSLGRTEQGTPLAIVTSLEDPALMRQKPQTFPELAPGQPRHSVSHTNVLNIMGRPHYYDTFKFDETGKVYSMPIRFSTTSEITQAPYGTWRWFCSLVHLIRGPITCTLVLEGDGNIDCNLCFIPQGAGHTADFTMVGEENFPTQYRVSFGVVHFNTAQTNTVQVKLPWYACSHAISPNLAASAYENIYGRIVVAIRNKSASEALRLNVYLGITEETECLFLRAPSVYNYVAYKQPVPTAVEILTHEATDETLQDFVDRQDLEHRSQARGFRQKVLASRLYKDLRMEVGVQRLLYAREELKKSRSSENLLAQAGFDIGEILVCEEDRVTLSGVFCDNHVVFVDCINRTTAFMGVTPELILLREPIVKKKWVSGQRYFDRLETITLHQGFNKMTFVPDNFARVIVGNKLEPVAHIIRGLFPKIRNPLSTVVGDSVPGRKVALAADEIMKLTAECQKFLKGIQESLRQLADNMTRKKRETVVFVITAIVKAGLMIYICVKCEWKISVVLSALTILAMDTVNCYLSLEGIVGELLGSISSHLGLKAQGVSIRDVASGLSVAKSIKDIIAWLYKFVRGWYDETYGKTKQLLEFLSDSKDTLDSVLTEVDEVMLMEVDDSNRELIYERSCDLVRQLRTLNSLCHKHEGLNRLTTEVNSAIRSLSSKVRSLGVMNARVVSRPEPFVIYLYGDKGSGKSLASMALAVKLCKGMGVDHRSSIYTRPVGADYWDGYSGQPVVILDDVGQKSDDSDWSEFCQLVSTAPLRLNMASLEEKGKHFTSPIIIATSNLATPSPKTVYNVEAILRRLHLQVKVEIAPGFGRTCGDYHLLDVSLAKAKGAVANMECVRMTSYGAEISLQEIVDTALCEIQRRTVNHTELMDLWAQADDVVSLDFLQSPVKPSGRLDKVWPDVDSHICWLVAGALSCVGLIVAVWGGTKLIKKLCNAEAVEQRAYNVKPTKISTVVDLNPSLSTQSVMDVAALVNHNLMRFGVGIDGTVKWTVNCLGLRDNFVLVPQHGWEFEDTDSDPEFYFQKGLTYYMCNKSNVVVHQLSAEFGDVVCMQVPGLPKCKDITQHFVKENDIHHAEKQFATLVTINGGVHQMISEGKVELLHGVEYSHHTRSGKDYKIVIGRCWRGHGEALPGSCGGALVTSSNKAKNAILGIHVAAGGGQMISALVTQEMLGCIDKQILEATRITEAKFVSQGCSLNNKTKLRPSPIADYVPSEYAPSCMPFRNTDVDPLGVVLKKYSVPLKDEPKDYASASNFVADQLAEVIDFREVRLLSEQEAIEGHNSMEGIDMNTSPGYPYVCFNLRKTDLIKHGRICHPMLKERFVEVEKRAFCGFQQHIVFVTSFKDELRPIEKVNAGDTRLIECGPLHFLLFVRRIWGSLQSQLLEHVSYQTSIAVGIDPERDWHPMIRKALIFGDTVLQCDFSNFDATLHPYMIERAIKVLCDLSLLPMKVFESVSNAIVYSRHIMGNLMFKTQGSLPSGCPSTSLINSLVNVTNIYYCLSKVKGCTYWGVKQNFLIMAYGDDMFVVVKRGVSLNVDRFQYWMSELGLKVTSVDKQPQLRLDPISDLQFLKRGWCLGPYKIIAPVMSRKTIHNMLHWCRGVQEFEQNVAAACQMIACEGSVEYKAFVFWLQDLLAMADQRVKLEVYEYWRDRFLGLSHCRPF
nr:MAG: polyprotein [Picornaviridae sp.]